MPQPLINITRKQALSFAVFLVLYEFLTYIANDLIMPGMIKVVAEFHASESNVATSLTAYVLGGASLQLFLGPLSDRYGRRPVMLFGAFLFFICTALIVFTHSINQFLFIRFLEGMGLCFINVIGYAVLQEIFAEMDAIRLIAIMGNVAIMAPLIGPLVGALALQYVSWRFIFLVIAFLSLIAWWGFWRFMPETVGQVKRDGQEIKVTPLSVTTIYTNYKKLLTTMPFILGAIGFGVMGTTCVAWIGLSPVMIVTQAKQSLVDYALWQIPVFGAFIVGNIILVRLTRSLSVKKIMMVGNIISVIGLFLMSLLPNLIGPNYVWLIPGLIIHFCGYGILATPLNRHILFSTKVSKGTASALISMISMCVQGTGIEVANQVYSSNNNIHLGNFAAILGIICFIIISISIFANHVKHK